jgi:hypothetical protein
MLIRALLPGSSSELFLTRGMDRMLYACMTLFESSNELLTSYFF